MSVEERTQLQRVFRLLSLELPLSAITRKLEVKQNCFVFVNLSSHHLHHSFEIKLQILDKSFLATDISAPIVMFDVRN